MHVLQLRISHCFIDHRHAACPWPGLVQRVKHAGIVSAVEAGLDDDVVRQPQKLGHLV